MIMVMAFTETVARRERYMEVQEVYSMENETV